MKTKPIVLIIDPALNHPCLEATNCLSKIVGELRESSQFAFSHCEYVSPFLNKLELKNFVTDKNIGAVVCLGSVVNVTDDFPQLQAFMNDVQNEILKRHIPFFGICFSHQLLASLHGYKVNFLKQRFFIPGRRHHAFREFQIIHPKLAILATDFSSNDYFSDNYKDLEFKNAIYSTRKWNKIDWERLLTDRPWILTPNESRILEHIRCKTVKKITSHARHEQEVWEKHSHYATDVVLAGTSDLCSYEALVHHDAPFFTLQTHPETKHESNSGYLLLKNFLYMASLLYRG